MSNWKEALRHTYYSGRKHEKLGFSSILSIHTIILNKVCLGLKILTLNIRNGKDIDGEPGPAPFWDDDVDDLSGKGDMEKIDVIVGKIVKGLPSLRELKLGEYRMWTRLGSWSDDGTINDEWGTSLRWEQFVKERYAKRFKENVKISGRAKVRTGGDGGVFTTGNHCVGVNLRGR